MEKRRLKHKSQYDQHPLDILLVTPDTPPKALVQISHGMAEHKERYLPFMEFLTQHGYAAMIHDHRGHGNSIRQEDDLGYFYDNTAKAIVQDLHDLSLWYKQQYPGLPLYLFGHSMGSLVVRAYLKQYDNDIDKLVVCGSPSNNKATPIAKALVKTLQKIKGDRYRSATINNLATGSYDKQIPGTQTNRWLTKNEDNVNTFNNHPKDGFIFTLNGFENLFNLLEQVYDNKGWLLKNPNLPILFIAGSDDPVILNEKAWHEARKFLETIGYKHTQYKLYPTLRHEILLEKEADQVMQDILTFFES